MRSILAVLAFVYSTSSFAQAIAVNFFQPVPGGALTTAQYFQEAKSILSEAGAQVVTNSDLKGIYRFAMIFENWEAYGEFSQSLSSNHEWAAFQQRTARNPSAMQIDNLLLNQVAAPASPGGGPGTVTQVTVWELTPTGTMQALVDGAMGAKDIHERAGARVSVFTDTGGGRRMYYLMNFDDFAAWGRFRDTPNPEFNAYMQAAQANGPSAVIVDQSTTTAF